MCPHRTFVKQLYYQWTKSFKNWNKHLFFLYFINRDLAKKKSGQCWRGELQIEAVRSMWSLQCPNFRCDVSWHGWDCFSLSDPLGSHQGQSQPWICVRSDPCHWSDVFFCKEGELRVTKDSSASYHTTLNSSQLALDNQHSLHYLIALQLSAQIPGYIIAHYHFINDSAGPFCHLEK